MEKNKTLYKTFTELALKIVLSKGMNLLEAKKIVVQKFENHPFDNTILRANSVKVLYNVLFFSILS